MRPATDAPAPRVAVLVNNDCSNDSRVLKESASLEDAGYRVRIIAVERRQRGFVAGTLSLDDKLDLVRVPEFTIERIVPSLAPLWRNLIRDEEIASEASLDQPLGPPVSDPETSARQNGRRQNGRLAAVRIRGLRALRNVGERVYRTLSLGTYWVNATLAGHRFGPDVVHANDANTLVPALAIRALSCSRIPIVYDSHELWRRRNVRRGRLLAPLVEAITETVGVRAADGVITVSPSIAGWLQSTYRLPEEPIVVRNVPVADGPAERSTGVLRERAGLSPQHKVIAYGGRITTARGIEETIAALPHLEDHVHFVLLGYGEESALNDVRAHARAYGVADRVHLVGAVPPDEVSQSLADGDVAVVHVRPVCLSYRFALPNKLFESIRAGLPIAAADLPDMKAVVADLGVGEVFRGSCAEDLAHALQSILDSPDRYRQRTKEVGPGLIWEREADTMLELYGRVLARRQVSGS